MVVVSPQPQNARRVANGPTRTLALISVILSIIVVLQGWTLWQTQKASQVRVLQPQPGTTVQHLRSPQPDQCRWYVAESAIPHAGLGVYAGVGLFPGDPVGPSDICIFVSDAPKEWTHLRSHSFGQGSFFGQYEGSNSRAACEGFSTLYNTAPQHLVNTNLGTPQLPTHAGLKRDMSPGAGSITHHFGMHGSAIDIVTAGSEMIIDYGDWDFSSRDVEKAVKAQRSVEWLAEHGWCVDKVVVGQSTIPHAGRGLFASRPLVAGEVVLPAPLQVFENRSLFSTTEPEQLFVNYNLQPAESDMMVYPYGPTVNLVNHGKEPNLKWQWSSHPLHHGDFLDLPLDDFWEHVKPGSLILELVAVRDIFMGEELLVDYGTAWEAAWKAHVESWKPPSTDEPYVYPQEMDETEPLRTVSEQVEHPYPPNIMTMCVTGDWDREDGRHVEWEEPTEYTWWEGLLPCHILARGKGPNHDPIYHVELVYSSKPKKQQFDPDKDDKDRYVDLFVPRRAIRFVERPYHDDEHLLGAFRHPLEFPAHLVPDTWKRKAD